MVEGGGGGEATDTPPAAAGGGVRADLAAGAPAMAQVGKIIVPNATAGAGETGDAAADGEAARGGGATTAGHDGLPTLVTHRESIRPH